MIVVDKYESWNEIMLDEMYAYLGFLVLMCQSSINSGLLEKERSLQLPPNMS